MTNKLYVGNIPFSITQADLNELFASKGAVAEVNIIEDRETGRPRGFAFVTMASADEADRAVRDLDGEDFQGRRLTVNVAQERAARGGERSAGGGSRW
jgi:RNA recognition motif-containing protein